MDNRPREPKSSRFRPLMALAGMLGVLGQQQENAGIMIQDRAERWDSSRTQNDSKTAGSKAAKKRERQNRRDGRNQRR